MSATGPAAQSATPLAAWHQDHGARMVAFAGWLMPLHYAQGITREHVATRTTAGLFDVSHMGRFRIVGRDCAQFLSSVLTNDARTLVPGVAHYTLFATQSGGALDDAYLYRLADEAFLLVVNAANRRRDWERLMTHVRPAGVTLVDETEACAMLAVQGPRSAAAVAAVLGEQALPAPKRNRLRQATFAGEGLMVARTGYTGEAECFELVLPAHHAEACWQGLVDAGAVPAGLGARDSLRLEAGLPLYGHELGVDREGREIPIFANALARFGVRRPGNGEYPGRAALDAQRAAQEALALDPTAPAAAGVLPQMVRPLAVFDARRPLRAGYDLFLDGEPVGYVTSGTSVPVVADGADVPQMRPIGLALLRSDIRYRSDATVRLTVRDGRGGEMPAHLVERNLPPAPRPATGAQ